jgi:hypothetical protein
MTRSTIPIDSDSRFVESVDKSNAIGEKHASATPEACVQPSLASGLTGRTVSWSRYIGPIFSVGLLRRWYLVPAPLAIAGLGGCKRHCISRDCRHGPFSRNCKVDFPMRQILSDAFALPGSHVPTPAQSQAWPNYRGIGRAEKPNLCEVSGIRRRCRSYDLISGSYPTRPMPRIDPVEGGHV